MFGVSPDKTIQVILPDDVTSFNLPDGGTVAAQLSGKVESVSRVNGQLTSGKKRKE
jgi:translation initiation factor IF-1